MLKSDKIEELAKALVLAQAELKNAKFDKKGVYNDYASLKSIRDAIHDVLLKHGICYFQPINEKTVETILLHTSGQFIGSITPIFAEKLTPQGLGSAITYARRYGLAAIVGISSDDDDDAESAENETIINNKKSKTIPLVFEKATQEKETPEEWVEAFITQVSNEQIPEPEHKKFVDKNLETGRKIYAQMKAKNPEKAEQLAKIFTRFK